MVRLKLSRHSKAYPVFVMDSILNDYKLLLPSIAEFISYYEFRFREIGKYRRRHETQDQIKQPVFGVTQNKLMEERIQSAIHKKMYLFCLPKERFVCIGHTLNNLREFNFIKSFSDANELGHPFTIYSNGRTPFYFKDKLLGKSAYLCKPILAEVISAREVMDAFVGVMKSINDMDYCIDYCFRALLEYLSAISILAGNKDLYRIPSLIFANDHVPLTNAYLFASKILSIPSIYLQHASVTPIFPPLDYDLSILYNRKSFQVYSEKENFDPSKCVILPRIKTISSHPARTTYFSPSTVPVKVVIYLGGRFNPVKLKSAIEILQSHKLISSINIKPHPNLDYLDEDQKLFIQDNLAILQSEIPKSYHIALCCCSSVITELALQRVPTYYVGDFDDMGDYYGFIRDKLACAIIISDLKTDKWLINPFVASTSSIIDYDASLEKTSFLIGEKNRLIKFLDQARFSLQGQEIFYSITDGEDKPRMRYFKGLANEAYRIFLQDNHKVNYFLASSRLKLLQSCFQNRRAEYLFLFACGARVDPSQVLRIYCKYTHAVLSRQKIISIEQIVLDIKAIEFDKADCSLHSLAYSSLIDYVGNNFNALSLNINFFDIFKKAFKDFGNSYQAHKLLLKFKMTCEVSAPEYKYTTNYLCKTNHRLRNCPSLHLRRAGQIFWDFGISGLKAANSDFTRNFMSYSSLCMMLISNISKSSDPRRSDLISYFEYQHKLCVTRSPKFFMDMRSVPHRSNQFILLIEDALVNRIPFSYIRISDGEGYIFMNSYFTHDDCRNRERHWWGTTLTANKRKALQKRLLVALSNADVLGIPSVYRFLRDHQTDKMLGQTVQSRGLLSVINRVIPYIHNDLVLTEEKTSSFLFTRQAINALALHADHIIVVASISTVIVKKIIHHAIVHHLPIPTHVYTKDNPFYASRSSHKTEADSFGNSYMEYLKPFKKILLDLRGQRILVLVGAGIAGKIFIDISKRYGAVGLDIGEAVDSWI